MATKKASRRSATSSRTASRTSGLSDAFDKAIAKEDPSVQEIKRLQRQLKQARVSTANEKRYAKELEKKLGEAEERVEVALALDLSGSTEVKISTRKTSALDALAHVFCSDWHVGERVDPKKVDGLNRYDAEIASDSIDQLFERVIQIVTWRRKSNLRIPSMILGLGGDLMTGHLHEDQRRTNTMHPFEECGFLIDHLEAQIHRVLDRLRLEKLWVPCVRGNHGRNHEGKKRYNVGAEDSYEQFVYGRLARIFEGDRRVEFILTESEYVHLDVAGRRFRYMHGDQFRYAGGVGGVTVPAMRFVQRLDQNDPNGRAYVNYMGHWHDRTRAGTIRINGSLCGTTSYGYGLGLIDGPKQDFQIYSTEHGLIDSCPLLISRKL